MGLVGIKTVEISKKEDVLASCKILAGKCSSPSRRCILETRWRGGCCPAQGIKIEPVQWSDYGVYGSGGSMAYK